MLHRPSCVLFVGHPLIFLRAKMKITLFYMDDKLKFTLFFIPSVQNLLTYRRELCDVFFKGKRLCENCHSWRKSPRSRAGSDDALIWYLRFSSRKLLTTFRVPFCQLKLVLVQRKRKSCQEVLSTFVVFYILLMLQTSESFFFFLFSSFKDAVTGYMAGWWIHTSSWDDQTLDLVQVFPITKPPCCLTLWE